MSLFSLCKQMKNQHCPLEPDWWLLGLTSTNVCWILLPVFYLVFWKVTENTQFIFCVAQIWWASFHRHHASVGPLFCCLGDKNHGLHQTFLLPSDLSCPFLSRELSSKKPTRVSPKGPWSVGLCETISVHWTKSFLPLLHVAHSTWEELTLSSIVCINGRGRDGAGIGGWNFLLPRWQDIARLLFWEHMSVQRQAKDGEDASTHSSPNFPHFNVLTALVNYHN